MDSPQFTGLILAYLRGLLKPGYPNGRTSYLREQILIAALQKEELAKTYDQLAVVTAATADMFTTNARRGKLKEMMRNIVHSHALRNHNSMKTAATTAKDISGDKSVRQMVSAYKVLSQTDIVARLQSVVDQI